jgi:flagellar hook assembly protein FlgD
MCPDTVTGTISGPVADANTRLSIGAAVAGDGVKFTVALPEAGGFTLDVFDISDKKVWRYEQSQAIAGTHRIIWDGRDKHSELVPDGIYLIRISTNNIEKKTRLILVK